MTVRPKLPFSPRVRQIRAKFKESKDMTFPCVYHNSSEMPRIVGEDEGCVGPTHRFRTRDIEEETSAVPMPSVLSRRGGENADLVGSADWGFFATKPAGIGMSMGTADQIEQIQFHMAGYNVLTCNELDDGSRPTMRSIQEQLTNKNKTINMKNTTCAPGSHPVRHSTATGTVSFLRTGNAILCYFICILQVSVATVIPTPPKVTSTNLDHVEPTFRIHVSAAHNLTATPHGAVAGDFDGDGLLDTILGAPDAAPGGRAGAGAVYLIYGAGLVEGSDTYLSDLADQGKGFAILGNNPGDLCGAAVGAAGDLNGDGFEDLAIGCLGALGGAGVVYVLFGAPAFHPVSDLDLSEQNNPTLSTVAVIVVHGGLEGGQLGAAVRGVGDVNGDGFDDLALAAPSAAVGDLASAGIVYLILGSADGFPATVNLTTTEHSQYQVQLRGELAGDRAGHYIEAAGDLNGDGCADFTVGTHRTFPAGAAYIVFGRATMPIERARVLFWAAEGVMMVRGQPYHALLVVGGLDINGDGLDDLLFTNACSAEGVNAAIATGDAGIRAWYGNSVTMMSVDFEHAATVWSFSQFSSSAHYSLVTSGVRAVTAAVLCVTEDGFVESNTAVVHHVVVRDGQIHVGKPAVILEAPTPHLDCAATAIGTVGDATMCYLSGLGNLDAAVLHIYCGAQVQARPQPAAHRTHSAHVHSDRPSRRHINVLEYVSFAFTGDYQNFTVPEGVYNLTVTLYGAAGGSYDNSGTTGVSGQGGLGAMMKASIPVTPGEILRVYVGGMGPGQGGPSGGGWNGGGARYTATFISGGGGGGTDIRRSPYSLADRLVVAGGGGGGIDTATYNCTCSGGNGGYPYAANGTYSAACTPSEKEVGGGGTQTAGGSGYDSGDGALFYGGQFASDFAPGGGGGYYGGGAGRYLGGGGGSSYSVTTPISYDQGSVTGDGSALIEYAEPPTMSPSMLPTTPTVLPSAEPSTPTASPTSPPSVDPTAVPSTHPTLLPSAEPSAPTASPTSPPSTNPTASPSPAPTSPPTIAPTIEATAEPSRMPTRAPTRNPSRSPTCRPSRLPTIIPSAVPSNDPTCAPTTPTAVPTASPSLEHCPTGWEIYENKCYNFDNLPSMNYSDCQSRCHGFSAEMICIDTYAVNSYLLQRIGSNMSFWLGLTDIAVEGSFQWSGQCNGIEPNWQSGVPIGGSNANCVDEFTTTAVWNEVNCNVSRVCVCEQQAVTWKPTAYPSLAPTAKPTFTPSPTRKPTASPSFVRCPTGWEIYDSKCYWFDTLPTMSWSSCQSRCQAESAQMLCVDSDQVDAYLRQRINNGDYWLGFTDIAVEGIFVWSGVCNGITPRWGAGEPNNYFGIGNEDCVEESASMGWWNDIACSVLRVCVCENEVETWKPTAYPTMAPTLMPTPLPSHPTSMPSAQPSGLPSAQPSAQPTRQPSNQPSRQPTRQPTTEPTWQPSGQPSGQPSSQPSRQPSAQPTRQASGQPSSQPTTQPSAQPTRQPSGQPSSQPSQLPSGVPSGQPTLQQSAQPTRQPILRPSRIPTSQPSGQPSTKPTGQPSTSPTDQPTSQPTHQSTEQPTRQPTALPSLLPSARPSTRPSRQPSGQPTRQPTQQPGSSPSTQPSGRPSSQPSVCPSGYPSALPSLVPTCQPRAQPSYWPTAQPVAQPSTQPSGIPRSKPTSHPTCQPVAVTKSKPTVQPSGQPTLQPVGRPSLHPIGVPSAPPSTKPSAQPFVFLTQQPTSVPSAPPSGGRVSNAPTMLPSATNSIVPGDPELRYANVSIKNATAQRNSIMLTVMTDGKTSAHVYCGAFRKMPVAPQLSTAIRTQGSFTYVASPHQTAVLTLTGLVSTAKYSVVCTSVTTSGVVLPVHTALRNLVTVTTLCCRAVQVRLLTSSVVSDVLQRRTVSVAVDDTPNEMLVVVVTFRALNGTASATPTIAYPDIARFANSSGGTLLLDVVGGAVGRQELHVSVQGLDSAHYEVQYLTGRLLIVQSATSAPQVPVLTGARFSSSGASVILIFDAPTDRGGFYNSFSCAELLRFTGSDTASCEWEDASRIVVYPRYVPAAADEVLVLDSNITLRSGAVRAQCSLPNTADKCLSWEPVPVTSVVVLPPLSIATPMVILAAPSRIGSCSSLVVDLTSSTGAAGRPWKSVQFRVTSGGGPPDAAQQLEIFLRSNYTISPPTAIPYAVFPKGVTYTIQATLCNFLWACGTGVATIQVSIAAALPILNIVGDSQRSVYRSTQFTSVADAYTQSCAGVKSYRNLRYLWSLKMLSEHGALVPTALVSTSQSETAFKLPPYALTVGQQYLLQVSVQSASSATSVESSVQITVLPSKIVANIAGGGNRYVSVGDRITIDASQSYDEDVAGQMGLAAGLRYDWACVQFLPTFSAMCPLNLPVVVDNQEFVRVSAAYAALNKTALVTVTVSDATRSSSASVQVTVTLTTPPQLQIVTPASALKKVNPDARLMLLGAVQTYSPCQVSWAVDDPNVNLVDVALTAVTASLAPSAVAPSPFNLVLTGGVLQPRATYQFSLGCGPFTASVTVTTNGSPLPGTFIIQPDNGEALITLYTFSASQWSDPDLPLTYQFGFESAVSLANLVVVSRSERSHTSTTLPAGRIDQGLRINASLEVFDFLAAVTAQRAAVVVRDLSPALQVQALLSLLNSSTGSADSVRNLISVVSTTINSVNCTGVMNCTALHREDCLKTSGECGPCLPSYIGDAGDRSTLCIPIRSVNAASIDCSSTKMCPEEWQHCNLFNGLCEAPLKTCSRNCSDNGQCMYVSRVTGAAVPVCRLDDTSCMSLCSCVGAFSGAFCELSINTLRFKRSVRSKLMEGLRDLTQTEDINTDTVRAWSASLYSLSIRPHELSINDIGTMAAIANATLQGAVNLGVESYADLLGVLQATDTTASLLKYNYNPNDYRDAAFNTTRSYVNNTAAAIVQTVSAFGDLVSRSMVLGQNRTALYYDNFRLSVDIALVGANIANTSLSSPQTDFERAQHLTPTMVSLTAAPKSNTTAVVAVQLIAVYPRSYAPDTTAFVSNPLTVKLLSAASDGLTRTVRKMMSTLSGMEFTFQSNGIFSDFLRDSGVNLTTVCTVTSDPVVQYTYQCPRSSVVLHHNCSRGVGTLVSFCPRPAPTCSNIDVDTTTMSAASTCRVTRFNSTYTVCSCSLHSSAGGVPARSTNRATGLHSFYLRGMPAYADNMLHQMGTSSEENSEESALLDETGAATLVVSTKYIASNFADTFTAADDFASPADAAKVIVVVVMLGIVWVPGLLAIIVGWITPAPRKDKVNPLANARQSVLRYVATVVPTVFTLEGSALRRAWAEVQVHHSFFNMFTDADIKKRTEAISKMLTQVTFMLFLVAVFFDVSTPTNDGSCDAHLTQESCLHRVSPFDYSQTYCKWERASSFNEALCVYHEQQPTYKALFYVTALTTVLTAIATIPLNYLFGIIGAPTANSLKGSRIAALSGAVAAGARRVSDAGTMAARRASILADQLMRPALHQSKSSRWSIADMVRRDRRESLSVARIVPDDVVQASNAARKSLAAVANNAQTLQLQQHAAERRGTARSLRLRSSIALAYAPSSAVRSAEATRSGDSEGKVEPLIRLVLQQRQLMDDDAPGTKLFDAQWGVQLLGADGVARQYKIIPEATQCICEEVKRAEKGASELVEVLKSYGAHHCGLELLHLFMVDLLGRQTIAAKVYQHKFGEDFEHSRVVVLAQKYAAIVALLGLNAFFAYYIMLKGFQQGYQWQLRYLACSLVQFFADVAIFETSECMWLNFSLPRMVRKEVEAAARKLTALVDRITTPGEDTENNSTRRKKYLFLNAPAHLFISVRLAKAMPHLLESMIVGAYTDHLPGEVCRTWPHYQRTRKNKTDSLSTYVFGIQMSWVVSLLRGLTLAMEGFMVIPYVYQKVFIRFVQPLIFAGLALVWSTLARNMQLLAVAFVVAAVVVSYGVYCWYQNHHTSSAVVAPDTEVEDPESLTRHYDGDSGDEELSETDAEVTKTAASNATLHFSAPQLHNRSGDSQGSDIELPSEPSEWGEYAEGYNGEEESDSGTGATSAAEELGDGANDSPSASEVLQSSDGSGLTSDWSSDLGAAYIDGEIDEVQDKDTQSDEEEDTLGYSHNQNAANDGEENPSNSSYVSTPSEWSAGEYNAEFDEELYDGQYCGDGEDAQENESDSASSDNADSGGSSENEDIENGSSNGSNGN